MYINRLILFWVIFSALITLSSRASAERKPRRLTVGCVLVLVAAAELGVYFGQGSFANWYLRRNASTPLQILNPEGPTATLHVHWLSEHWVNTVRNFEATSLKNPIESFPPKAYVSRNSEQETAGRVFDASSFELMGILRIAWEFQNLARNERDKPVPTLLADREAFEAELKKVPGRLPGLVQNLLVRQLIDAQDLALNRQNTLSNGEPKVDGKVSPSLRDLTLGELANRFKFSPFIGMRVIVGNEIIAADSLVEVVKGKVQIIVPQAAEIMPAEISPALALKLLRQPERRRILNKLSRPKEDFTLLAEPLTSASLHDVMLFFGLGEATETEFKEFVLKNYPAGAHPLKSAVEAFIASF